MKIRIVSTDGTGYNTRILDAATGTDLSGLHVTDIHISIQDANTATLQTFLPDLDIVADAVIIYRGTCPHCGYSERVVQ